MTSRDFCYWLQGFFEIADPTNITPQQATTIRNHLNMVFVHEIDPSFPAEQQTALNAAHAGTSSGWPNTKPTAFDPIEPAGKPFNDVKMRC
jgi:hypothetical protein